VAIGDHQRRHHLRQARDRQLASRMARPQHLAGVDVEQDACAWRAPEVDLDRQRIRRRRQGVA
jgi:hypothetical protein